MKTFYSQSSFVIPYGYDYSYGKGWAICGGWVDFDIILKAENKQEARKKIWKWAKAKGARQRDIRFCDKEMFYNDLCGDIVYINKQKGKKAN